MVEFVFSNLSIDHTASLRSLHDLLNDIIDHIASNSNKLMKLKLSNMNLRNDTLVDSICRVIETNKLILFDVSWAKLRSKELNTIAETL